MTRKAAPSTATTTRRLSMDGALSINTLIGTFRPPDQTMVRRAGFPDLPSCHRLPFAYHAGSLPGSSPRQLLRPGPVPRPHRLAWSRTPPFHGGNTGSNPVGVVEL